MDRLSDARETKHGRLVLRLRSVRQCAHAIESNHHVAVVGVRVDLNTVVSAILIGRLNISNYAVCRTTQFVSVLLIMRRDRSCLVSFILVHVIWHEKASCRRGQHSA